MKKLLKFTSTFILFILTIGCQEAKVAKIEFSRQNFVLPFTQKGQSGTLKAQAFDERGSLLSKKLIHFSSNDDSVATIDKNGLLTAVGSGETEIVAISDKYQEKFKVNVLIVARVEVDPPGPHELPMAEKIQLSAKAFDDKGNEIKDPKVLWKSSNFAVEVRNGEVEGMSMGDGEIIVRVLNKSTSVKFQVTDFKKK